MRDSDRQTRSHLMQLFERHGFHPRSDLGQNFLIDLNIVEFVVRQAELSRDDVVLEIGAGTGGMTTFMAREAGHVISVEFDKNMHMLASEAVVNYDNVTLLRQDALKNKNRFATEVLGAIDRELAVNEQRELKLVANLPYNIATPVISNLVATDLPWTRQVVTIQFELGLRMQARPRSSHYGSLSVWLQSQCDVEMLKKLGPTVFWPRPKVDSAIMRIVPDPRLKARIDDRAFFHDYVRRVFNYRRKLMRGVLCGMYRKELTKPEVDEILKGLALTETVRAEELDVATHVELANRFRAEITSQSDKATTADSTDGDITETRRHGEKNE